MTRETKDFFSKYWQAIVIAISINILIGFVTNIGAYKVILFRTDDHERRIQILETSNVDHGEDIAEIKGRLKMNTGRGVVFESESNLN